MSTTEEKPPQEKDQAQKEVKQQENENPEQEKEQQQESPQQQKKDTKNDNSAAAAAAADDDDDANIDHIAASFDAVQSNEVEHLHTAVDFYLSNHDEEGLRRLLTHEHHCQDEDGEELYKGPLLHVACKLGRRAIVRYLLRGKRSPGNDTTTTTTSTAPSPTHHHQSHDESKEEGDEAHQEETEELLVDFGEAINDLLLSQATEAAFQMLAFQRYSLVLFMCKQNPQIAKRTQKIPPKKKPSSKGSKSKSNNNNNNNNNDGSSEPAADDTGNTILHATCMRKKPSPVFIQELLHGLVVKKGAERDEYVNKKNTAGYTPLHLVAKHSSGIEGKEVCKLLMHYRANAEAPTPEGGLAATISSNQFVREALGIAGPSPKKIRRLPEVDDKTKLSIDSCNDVSQLPPLKPIEDPSAQSKAAAGKHGSAANNTSTSQSTFDTGAAASPTSQPARKPQKKMNGEEVEGMVTRLFTQSITRKDQWMSTQLSKIQDAEEAKKKKFSADEEAEAVDRLYASEVTRRAEKQDEMRGKYLKDPSENAKTISVSEMEECSNRLCKGSLDFKAKSYETLLKRYSPERERRTLSKDQVAESAVRLHDESNEKSRVEMEMLSDKYCSKHVSRFNGQTKLTKEQVRTMGDRLSKKH